MAGLLGRQIIELPSLNKAAQHTLIATVAQSRFNIGPIGISCLVEKLTDESVRIVLNPLQVILAAEAFRINLIDILRSRWPGGKPATPGDHLNSADRFVIAGGSDQLRFNRLASKLFRVELCWIQLCDKFFLVARGRRIDPLVQGFAQIVRHGRVKPVGIMAS